LKLRHINRSGPVFETHCKTVNFLAIGYKNLHYIS